MNNLLNIKIDYKIKQILQGLAGINYFRIYANQWIAVRMNQQH